MNCHINAKSTSVVLIRETEPGIMHFIENSSINLEIIDSPALSL